MDIQAFSNLIPCAKGPLKIYLCRQEFSHIKTVRNGRKLLYKNINREDIEKLRKLFDRRPAHSGDR